MLIAISLLVFFALVSLAAIRLTLRLVPAVPRTVGVAPLTVSRSQGRLSAGGSQLVRTASLDGRTLRRLQRSATRAGWLTVAILAVTHGSMALATFKCVDEMGRTHFAETLPAGCVGTIYEINGAGTVVRKTETQERPEKTSETTEKAADERKAAERRRRDAVLLDSYSSEREIDAARDRRAEILNTRLLAARTQLKKIQRAEKEVEALVARNPQHASDLQRVKAEAVSAEASVARLERELNAVREQFTADTLRWKELRSAGK